MKVRRRDKQWWVDGVPPYTADGLVLTSWGPYVTRQEAEEDLAGVERTLKVWKPKTPPVEIPLPPKPKRVRKVPEVEVAPEPRGPKKQLAMFL